MKTQNLTIAQKQDAFINELLKTYKKKEGSGYTPTTDEVRNWIERYINATKEGRMLCVIDSVSSSGMSRTMRFLEMAGNKKTGHNILQFRSLFRALGYTPAGRYFDGFRIGGCGMDMVFHTNYTIIHNFCDGGFLSSKECAKLAQKTPHKI